MSLLLFHLLGGATDPDRTVLGETDSSGNLYALENVGDAVPYSILSKYSQSGVLQWTVRFSSSNSVQGCDLKVASTGNIYLLLCYGGNGKRVIAKVSSTGTLTWQKYDAGANDVTGRILLDGSENVYVCAQQSTGIGYSYVSKYSSAGIYQWQRRLSAAYFAQSYGAAIDSSGNVYVGLLINDNANDGSFLLVKYSNAGALQWQVKVSGFVTPSSPIPKIAVDSTGNVYVASGASTGEAHLIKLNASGALQWTTKITGIKSPEIESDGSSIYLASGDSGLTKAVLSKFTAAGAMSWSMNLSASQACGPSIFGVNGSYMVVGISHITQTTPSYKFKAVLARMAITGSGAGTYGSFTYATGSVGTTSSSLTVASGSYLTDAAGSITSSDSPLTFASVSQPQTTLILGT